MVAKWIFVDKVKIGVRVEKYGQPYDATVRLVVANNELHVEGLLSNGTITREDIKEIERKILSMGFSEYKQLRYKKGVGTITTKKIKPEKKGVTVKSKAVDYRPNKTFYSDYMQPLDAEWLSMTYSKPDKPLH